MGYLKNKSERLPIFLTGTAIVESKSVYLIR